jgi:hypothetical protein
VEEETKKQKVQPAAYARATGRQCVDSEERSRQANKELGPPHNLSRKGRQSDSSLDYIEMERTFTKMELECILLPAARPRASH